MNRTEITARILLGSLTLIGSYCPALAATPGSLEAIGPARERPIASSEPCATRVTTPPAEAPDASTIQRLIAQGRISAGGVVPVHFHVIEFMTPGGVILGYVDQSQLTEMINVLNNTFAGLGYNGIPVPGAANTHYTFFQAGVDYTVNNSWYAMSQGSRAEKQAKSALAIDPEGSLNLYTGGMGAFGWATFPWDLAHNGVQDGVVVGWGSLPGTTYSGGIPVHETGHWMGLYHTFQGGCHPDRFCDTKGDRVCDTPAEATPGSGCPADTNTCDDGVGFDEPDPIHNYMDYSGDACFTNFTLGQDARMDFMMGQYRPLIGAARIALRTGEDEGAGRSGSTLHLRAHASGAISRVALEFTLKRAGTASIRMFDAAGRMVRQFPSREFDAGPHVESLDVGRLAAGVYWLQLRAEGQSTARRLMVLK